MFKLVLKLIGSVASTLALAAAFVATANAEPLDLTTGEGALAAFRKIQCSLNDQEPRTFWWHGGAYARVPGEKDQLLFRVEGMNIRQCGTVEDAKQGTGFTLVTREILLYKDPQTGEVLTHWDNPWSGERVEVIQVANDPVNNGPFFPVSRDGKPWPWFGTAKEGRWWITSTIPLFYTNALGGNYQQYVGGAYHATEMFNYMGDLESLVSEATVSANVQVGWVRMAQWLPWMKMGDRVGLMYMHTAGVKLNDGDDMSATMREQIATNFPEYAEPPPLDDDRPNETSWTYFKKILGQQAEPAEAGH
jgi:hypothetical protein